MKNTNILTPILIAGLIFALFAFNKSESAPAQQTGSYEFTSFTVIESIIPGGLGRSRIINSLAQRDFKEFTKVKSSDDRGRNKSKRSEIRVFDYEETKLLNFYNLVGIRFQNIAANDAIVNNKVNDMLNQGWEVVSINSGVESDAGKQDGEGIFITRFYFKRAR